MSDFNLSSEEINQIIMSSPFALPASPAENGLGAGQIKKYFYSFIRIFAEKLNIHLSDVAEALLKLENQLTDTNERWENELSEERELTLTRLGEHNENEFAHGDIRNLVKSHEKSHSAHDDIRELVTKHEESASAHGDIRELASTAQERADSAYNLARGRSKVYPVQSTNEMITRLMEKTFNVGDMFIIADKNVPDFTVYEYGAMQDGDVEITQLDAIMGIEFVPGTIYYFNNTSSASNPVRLIASEGGVDTRGFATSEELLAVEQGLTSHISDQFSSFEQYASENYAQAEDLETVESIAKGANQAISFYSYFDMITALNAAEPKKYNVGQNIYIDDLGVPDLWISRQSPSHFDYFYNTSDQSNEALIETMKQYKSAPIGYYEVSMLETQKVDLTEYVKNTDTNRAVKEGITNNAEALTDEEKTSACEWLGAFREIPQGTLRDVVFAIDSRGNKKWAGVDAGNGLALLSNGNLIVSSASDSQIKERVSKPLSAERIDLAVKEALTNSKLEWTEEEKAAARALLGIE